MKARKKPLDLGLVGGLFFLPLLFVAGAVSIPYAIVRRKVVARRESRFAESMKLSGRVMEWTDFIHELEHANGMLIVERFSFKGPIRLWWTSDNVYKICPHALVDWLTMVHDANFNPVRDWCHKSYTGSTGQAKCREVCFHTLDAIARLSLGGERVEKWGRVQDYAVRPFFEEECPTSARESDCEAAVGFFLGIVEEA